jgi:hypothetical protein
MNLCAMYDRLHWIDALMLETPPALIGGRRWNRRARERIALRKAINGILRRLARERAGRPTDLEDLGEPVPSMEDFRARARGAHPGSTPGKSR